MRNPALAKEEKMMEPLPTEDLLRLLLYVDDIDAATITAELESRGVDVQNYLDDIEHAIFDAIDSAKEEEDE